MSPSELRALYEPLWVAVPATRPTNDDGLPIQYGTFLRYDASGGERVEWGPDWNDGFDPVGHTAVAAMCRVAVEDWLDDHLPDGDMAKGAAREGGYWVGEYIEDGYDNPCRTLGSGPTRDHALVAAAFAVHAAITPDSTSGNR